jgi:mono/diheme cytochrome c family protein
MRAHRLISPKTISPKTIALGLSVAGAILAAGAALGASPPPYRAPTETATLAPGPNLETVQANCGACHSADYITTQPRTFANPRAVWTAEVAKMRKAYGATISDEDAAKIIDYLVATYGA